MRWWMSAVALGVVMGTPGVLAAQTTLLLDPIGVRLEDPSEGELMAALRAVVAQSGHTVVALPPGVVLDPIDPRTGEDLEALRARAGVDRVVAVWLQRGPLGHDILVAVASGPGSGAGAWSRARASSVADVIEVATAALTELLPRDFGTPRGGWEPPLDPLRRPPSRLGRGLFTFGGALLLGTYLPNVLGSALAGYQSSDWFQGTFDGAWDAFRVIGAVPVVGPWIQLGIAPTPPNGWIPWLVVDGILQGVAAALFVAGIALQVEAAAATPYVGPDGAGLRLAGSF